MINLLIADDHPIFRRGLAELLGQQKSFNVIAEACNGQEALEKISSLQIDIAILDISMPIHDGFQVLTAVKDLTLDTKFVVLTMFEEAAYAKRAFELGALGYLLKDHAEEELLYCLNLVQNNKQFSSLDYLENNEEKDQASKNLSPAEFKVFNLVSLGKSSAEIADILSLSIRTIDNHRFNMSRKLGLKGPHALLKYAIRH